MKKLTAALVISLGHFSPVFSQEEPSYEDTIAFIKTKIDVNNDVKSQVFSMEERCVASIYEASKTNSWYGGKFSHKQTVDLSDLDPSSVGRDTGPMTFIGREHRKIVDVLVTNQFVSSDKFRKNAHALDQTPDCVDDQLVCYGRDKQKYFFPSLILSPEQDNRLRYVRALQHLIKICGGKEELF